MFALAKASQVAYGPLLLSHPYAVTYPYLSAPLIAPFPAATAIVLKHHTPEHTAEQEASASKENEEKEKPLQPPVVSLLPYPLAAAAAPAPRLIVLR